MAGPIAYYEVRWRLADESDQWTTMTLDPTETSVLIKGVDRSRSYTIQARSVGPTGLKSVWVDISHSVAGGHAPVAPTGVGADSAADGVRVYWTLPLNAPADLVTCVERGTAVGGPFTEVTRARAHQVYIPEKIDGTFYYRIRTTNYRGEYSAYSTVVSASPDTLAEINAGIANALTTAQNAAAAADGTINTFFQTTPPGSGMSYGDIWYDTDDNRKIYRWDGDSWNYSPNDALAENILAAIDAQATADGKVTTYYQSTAPVSGMSLGDLWFDTTVGVKKLFRWNGTTWLDNIGDVTMEQLAGLGLNLMWDEYSRFYESPLPATTLLNGALAPTFDTDHVVGTGGSFKAITGGTNVSEGIFLGSTAIDYNLPLLPGKYLYSAYAQSDVAGHKVRLGLRRNSDNGFMSGSADITITAANTWERISVLIDVTSFTTLSAIVPFLYTNRSGVAGRTVKFDGLMIETQLGLQVTPSAWSIGKSARQALAAVLAASNAQDTADAAAADAVTSLNTLADIAADDKLTAGEKLKARVEYNEVKNEQAGIDAEATRYAITTAKTDYDDAITALKTYLKDTVGVLDASYNWIDITGTDTIVRATWDTKWQDVYFNRQTLLNSIAAKVGGQLQNGVMPPYAYGSELVPNGGFELITAGGGATSTTVGAVMADGWQIHSSQQGLMQALLTVSADGFVHTGANSQLINNIAGTMTPSSSTYCSVATKNTFPVQAGETYLVKCWVREDWANSYPAAIQNLLSIGLNFTTATGAFVSRAGIQFGAVGGQRATASGVWTELQAVVLVPATAVNAKPEFLNYFLNTVASNTAISANTSAVRIDDFSVKRIDTTGTGTNLLLNSEFGLGTTGWNSPGTVVAGQNAKRMTTAALGNGVQDDMYQDVTDGVVAGLPYSASVCVGASGLAGSAQAQMFMQFLNVSNSVLLTKSAQLIAANFSGAEDQMVIVGGVAPVNTTKIRFFMRFTGTGTWNFRKPKLEQGWIATAYTPGSDAIFGTELTYAGSARQIGDLRNINPVGHANVGSAWISGAITYTAAAGSPATATISMSAGTLRLGGVDIAYNAGSVGTTGTNGTAVTYLLYYDDPTYAGGTRTLGATTAYSTLINATGRVYVGSVTVNYPASGSGGGGGQNPCVTIDSYLPCGRLAGEIEVGDKMFLCDPETGDETKGQVSFAKTELVPCVEIITENLVRLRCSIYAPIPTDKGLVKAPFLMGRTVLTKIGDEKCQALVVDVRQIGHLEVRHITVEDKCFWAGAEEGMYLLHHNIKNDP